VRAVQLVLYQQASWKYLVTKWTPLSLTQEASSIGSGSALPKCTLRSRFWCVQLFWCVSGVLASYALDRVPVPSIARAVTAGST